MPEIRLPAGRRFTPYEYDEPVAWLIRRAVPDPGLIWSALTDMHGETGLVPVVLNGERKARPAAITFPGLAKYWYSPSGRKYTRRQVKAYYATRDAAGNQGEKGNECHRRTG